MTIHVYMPVIYSYDLQVFPHKAQTRAPALFVIYVHAFTCVYIYVYTRIKRTLRARTGLRNYITQIYADILRQIYYGRCITADITADVLWQKTYGRHITADISWQIYYGKYITADVLWQIN